MSEKKRSVILEDVAEQLDECMDGWEQFYNIETGEFEALADGTWVETDEELAEKIDSSDAYVRLPNQYDLHEYRIMCDFAEATSDPRHQQKLFRALNGRKPYRHFKDEINYLGIADAYYAYRFVAYCKIAAEWCEDNNIPYITREDKERGVH